MSKVVHPYSHRLGIIKDWKSRWFGDGKKYRDHLKADTLIRQYVTKRLANTYTASIEIDRSQKAVRLIIKSARPGLIIGRNGEGSEKLRSDIIKFVSKNGLGEDGVDLKIDIEEVRSPESNASVVAQQIKEGLEKRMPFRRILKQTADKVMANRDAQGVRIRIAGRLNGADMARVEELRKGRVPLQTFRADIDFARVRATIPQGDLGIKVWIYRGEIFEKPNNHFLNTNS